MIVIGVDAHKRTHTCVAVEQLTARQLRTRTAPATDEGHGELLLWARELDPERVWAIEDCRHVSGRLERFLLGRGERILRVPPKLMAGARKTAREPGPERQHQDAQTVVGLGRDSHQWVPRPHSPSTFPALLAAVTSTRSG
jgi:Transposase